MKLDSINEEKVENLYSALIECEGNEVINAISKLNNECLVSLISFASTILIDRINDLNKFIIN